MAIKPEIGTAMTTRVMINTQALDMGWRLPAKSLANFVFHWPVVLIFSVPIRSQ